jgi:hypothetical protein
MVKFQDVTFTRSPFGAFTLGAVARQSPLIAAFRRGRLEGYIADAALHGAFRRENDEMQQRLGYRVGKWPAVPLRGRIVTASPKRILELYEAIATYRSVEGAKEHLVALTHAHDGSVMELEFHIRLGDGTYAYAAVPDKQAPQREWGYGIDVRKGTSIIQLGVWGGREITRARATALARTALHRVEEFCTGAE